MQLNGYPKRVHQACAGVVVAIGVLTSGLVQAAAMQAQRQYPASSAVESPWTGIGFTVPAGFTGAYEPQVETFLMASADRSILVALYGASEATLGDMVAYVEGRLDAVGIQVGAGGPTRQEADFAQARYVAIVDGAPRALHVAIRIGKHRNGFAAVALGPSGADASLAKTVSGIVDGARWTTAEAASWRTRLAGKVLYRSGSGSDYSSGGAGGYASYASNTKTRIDFCGNGAYRFESSGKSHFSTDAGSVESDNNDAHQGRWWLVADLVGRAFVSLEANDGRSFIWSIEETQDGANVDGASYSVAASDRCI